MLETGSYKDVLFAKEVCFVGDNETKVFIYNVDGLLIDCGPKPCGAVLSVDKGAEHISGCPHT